MCSFSKHKTHLAKQNLQQANMQKPNKNTILHTSLILHAYLWLIVFWPEKCFSDIAVLIYAAFSLDLCIVFYYILIFYLRFVNFRRAHGGS